MKISELCEELDIEHWCETESVSYRLTRGRSGMQLNVTTCPHCGDERSRVYLNQETGVGNCFVCNTTFNKATFVKAVLGDAGWSVVADSIKSALKEQGWRPRRKEILVAVDDTPVQLPASFALPTDEGQNLLYLENRGINGELAKYFHLRFCENGWWNFDKPDGSRGGQNFGGRIVIPVYDLDGSLVTFQGRDATGKSETRYLFPSQLPGTGRFLYNGQNAGLAAHVVIGEGAFDVMAIKRAIDQTSEFAGVVPVGTFGKHLSYGSLDGNDQLGRLLELRRGRLRRVTMMYDGSPDALVAAIAAGELLGRNGISVAVALLPRGRDPNEVDAEVVRDAIRKAEPLTAAQAIRWRLRNPYFAAKDK